MEEVNVNFVLTKNINFMLNLKHPSYSKSLCLYGSYWIILKFVQASPIYGLPLPKGFTWKCFLPGLLFEENFLLWSIFPERFILEKNLKVTLLFAYGEIVYKEAFTFVHIEY